MKIIQLLSKILLGQFKRRGVQSFLSVETTYPCIKSAAHQIKGYVEIFENLKFFIFWKHIFFSQKFANFQYDMSQTKEVIFVPKNSSEVELIGVWTCASVITKMTTCKGWLNYKFRYFSTLRFHILNSSLHSCLLKKLLSLPQNSKWSRQKRPCRQCDVACR